MIRILITGANGFIGTSLIKALLQQPDYFIYCLSRNKPETHYEKHEFISRDLSLQGWTTGLPSDVDVILHLAQSQYYREGIKHSSDLLSVNVSSTIELLEFAKKNRVKKFIFFSTGSVYKESEKILDEESECEPVDLYSASKLSCEHIIKQYSTIFETIILRLFTVYGSSQRNKLIPNMISAISSRESICLAGGVGAYLTPTYISDCVKIVSLLLKSNKMPNTVYNLCGKEQITLFEIIQHISQYLKIPAKIINTNQIPKHSSGSNNRLSTDLKYYSYESFKNCISSILSEESIQLEQ